MAEFDQQYLGSLVRMAQRGDKNAFAELYAATYQREYFFCFTYLKDIELARAAVQETYISVFKNLLKLRDPGLFVSWLNQICFHVCFRSIEQQKRARMELDDEDFSPDDEHIFIEGKEYLIRQILTFPFAESQALILKYYQKMDMREIATLMDISMGSLNRCLQSAKQRLDVISIP